jgi:hypothetical protein
MSEQPIERRRWLLLLLALQLVLAGVAAGTALAARGEKPEAPVSTPDPNSVTRPLTVETGYQLGLQQAQTWRSDARLINIDMQIDWPSDPPLATVTAVPPGGWVAQTFVSPWDHRGNEAATLGMFFERGGGKLYGQSVTEWEHAPTKTLAIDQAKIDSTTAILAAELKGGTAYRAECPKNRKRSRITLTTQAGSDSGSPDQLVWLINYTDVPTGKTGFQVLVDANTGDIVKVNDTRASCDESS